MKKLILLSLFAVFALSTSQAQTLTEKSIRSSGFSQKKFKKAPRKIYINSFNVYFQVVGSASASTVGGEHFGRAHSSTNTTMGVQLNGVDVDDFMSITNAGYNLFVESLKSNGFEFVPIEQVAQTSLYDGWMRKEGGELSTSEVPGFVRATPNNFTYFVRGEKRSGKEKDTFFDRSPALSKELDDAIIVDINFTVHFVDMKTFSSEMLNISNVKGKIDFKLTPLAGASLNATQCNFSFGKTLTAATGQITNELKKVFPIEAEVFKDKKFSETNQASAQNVPQYHKVIFSGYDNVQVSHYAVADRGLYVSESERLFKEFLDLGLTNFYNYATK